MRILLINTLGIVCILAWSNYGASGHGGRFVSDETLQQYSSLTNGLGSCMGGIVNASKEEDMNEISIALSRLGGMMQDFNGPYGEPIFIDGRSFLELEEVFSRIAPFICLLPETKKERENIPHVLGGILGGLIGEMSAESLGKSQDVEEKTAMLTGLGSIAGAVGGMAGYEVGKGPFGKPDGSRIVRSISKFVSDMGDLKEVLKGSFEPLSDPTYSNLKKLVDGDMSRTLNKMGSFLQKASRTLYDTEKTKLAEFDSRFHGINSELADIAKSVSAMAGVFGGILGYVMPRTSEKGFFDETKVGMPASLRAPVISTSLGTTRSDSNGRQSQSDMFSGLLDDLATSAGEIGGYSGVIGGMMGEILVSGATTQAEKMSLKWIFSSDKNSDIHGKEEDNGVMKNNHQKMKNGEEPLISHNNFMKKFMDAVTVKGFVHLPPDSESCFEEIVSGISHFGKMNKFDEMLLPGALDFRGPYGGDDDIVSESELQRVIIGSQWNGAWDKPILTDELKHDTKLSEFLNVDASLHEDNALIYFINSQEDNSNLTQFLKGKLKFSALSEGDRQNINIRVLALLKPSVIKAFTGEDIASLFAFDDSSSNPERLSHFLKSVTDNQMNDALSAVQSLENDKKWIVSRDVARVVCSDLIRRFGQDAYGMLCPFAVGVSPGDIEKTTEELLFKETNLLTCLEDVKEDLTWHQKQAVVSKAMELNLTVENIQSVKSFSADFPSMAWSFINFTPNQMEALVDSGYFKAMKDISLKQKKVIVDVIIQNLKISNSNNGSTKFFEKLGSLICGIPVDELKLHVQAADLQDVTDNWIDTCITDSVQKYLEKVKTCPVQHSNGKEGLCEVKMKLGKRLQHAENYVRTRSAVKGTLSDEDVLPPVIAAGIDGLRLSEIERIPNSVLQESSHLFNNNPRLSKQQMRILLHKVLEGGQQTESVDELKELGFLLSEMDISAVSAAAVNAVLNERPDILRRFSKAKIASLFNKYVHEVGNAEVLSSMTSLSPLIPIDIIHSASELKLEVVARMKWSRPQGISILKKYKELYNQDILTLSDIKLLGKAAIGMTCEDVTKLPLFSAVDVARQIDMTVGNDIPSDLANCLATKIHLCLRMSCYKGGVDNSQVVGRFIPGNILLFMPSTVLISVSYGQNCIPMIKRLGGADIKLLPIGSGRLVIETVLQAARICFDTVRTPDMHGKGGFEGEEDSDDEYAGEDYQIGMQPQLDKKPKLNSKHRRSVKEASKFSADMNDQGLNLSPDLEAEDKVDNNPYSDKQVEDHQHPVGGQQLNMLGKFACSIGKLPSSFDAVSEFGRVLPMCIKRMNSANRKMVNSSFQTIFQFMDVPEMALKKQLLSHLGPLLPLVDPIFIKNNISNEDAFIMMQSLSSSNSPEWSSRDVNDDLSADSINFGNVLSLETVDFPEKPVDLDLKEENSVDMRGFSDAIFPKLYEYVVAKVNTTSSRKRRSTEIQSVHGGVEEKSELDLFVRRIRRQVQDDQTTPDTLAVETTEPLVDGNNNNDTAEYIEDSNARILYEVLLHAGPTVIGIPNDLLDKMSEDLFKDSLAILGRYKGWTTEQLKIIKSKMSNYGEVSKWKTEVLLDIGYLAEMLDVDEINQLQEIELETLSTFSRVQWPSEDHHRAVLKKFFDITSKNISSLQGSELIALGDLLCAVDVDDIPLINSNAIKFAVKSIGNRNCFKKSQMNSLKAKVLEAFDVSVNNPVLLTQLGIIAGSLSADEMKSIQPMHASLLHPNAFRVVDAQSVLDGWGPSHFALMGTKCGAVLLTRPDIFGQLNAVSKNAVFRATFGNNAGAVSSGITTLKHGKKKIQASFDKTLQMLMESLKMLFNKMHPQSSGRTTLSGPGSVFGLQDPKFFIPPPPPSFANGLSATDFSSTFSSSFLGSTRVISFINHVSSSNTNIFDVMRGSKSINELERKDIQTMPASVFEGMKASQIRGMSPSTITSMFESKVCTRNSVSMTKVINKMDTNQFEEALSLMNQKVTESTSSLTPWRPLITTQELIVKDYLKRLSSSASTDGEKVQKFLDNMCPFVAGIPSYMIRRIPMIASKKKELLDCMAESYLDLSMTLKKTIARWATQDVKFNEAIDLPVLGPFILDVSRYKVRKSLTDQMALTIVDGGTFEKLDALHSNFQSFAKLLLRSVVDSAPEKFDNVEFLDKLGASQCDVPLRKVKSSMSKASIKHLAMYTMQNCKSKEQLFEESMEQCDGEQALRLQRCQLLKHEKRMEKPVFGFSTFHKPKIGFHVGLDRFKMLRDLKESLFENDDLSKLSSEKMKENAGALGGLNPLEMDQLPDTSVLDSLDAFKDNTNLSPKQKKIMFGKCRKAGFSLDSSSSLSDLGELMTAVPADDLMKVSPDKIMNSLQDLKQRANAFSPSQTRAIVSKLQEVNMDDILTDDLGSFASEIPLQKLDTMENVNITQLKNQEWDRRQGLKLLEMYRNSTEEFVINPDFIGELGSTVIGLKCSDIMELDYFDALEAISAITTNADMDPDIDECMQALFHFAMQVEMGVDYMENDTIEVEELLESIPEDVAMFYPPEVVNETSDDLCDIIYEKIGQAQLNDFPPGAGDVRRIELALGAIECLERSPDRDFSVLEEDDVILLGNLICDIPPEYYQDMTADALDAALDFMKSCMHRFTKEHVKEFQDLVHTHYGEASTWDETTLASLGPLYCLMTTKDIAETNNDYFAETYDGITPPSIDPSVKSSSLINNDAFYEKAIDAIVLSNGENARRKRDAVTPTYDDIVALGLGNSKWSPEELGKISNSDIIASLDVLGAVGDWSSAQIQVLLQRLEEALEMPMPQWTATTIADAKHILKELSTDEIQLLDISGLETTTSLSDVSWSKLQQAQALDVYLTKSSKTVATLTAEDIAGLGNLLCGVSGTDLFNIPDGVISNAIKDLGELNCFDRDQLDTLYTMVMQAYDVVEPDASQLQEMGSLAAGMTTADLQAIPIENMPYLSVSAIVLMEPIRFRDGMTTSQLAAAGVTNVAAIISTTALYDALKVEQRNTLQTTAYGSNAVLENESNTNGSNPENSDTGSSDDDGNADAGITTKDGSASSTTSTQTPISTSTTTVSVEEFVGAEVKAEDTQPATSTSGSSHNIPQFITILCVLSFMCLCKIR